MNIAIKSVAVTLAIGMAFAAFDAGAAGTYQNDANAPARCQAFAPGPTNTIRNRVTGSENIGAAMNLACAFESISSWDHGQPVSAAGVQVGNYGNSALTVTCSELSGYFADAGTVITKSTGSIAPGKSVFVDFNADDTPDEDDSNLGSYAVGIVCNLPTHAIVSETYSIWDES